MAMPGRERQLHKSADAFSPQGVKELRKRIHEGLPRKELMDLADLLRVHPNDLGKLVSIPPRTLARRKIFTREESDRILQIEATVSHAVEVFQDAGHARFWMTSPSRALEGKTPLEYCDTSFGVHEVNNLLGRIEHNVLT